MDTVKRIIIVMLLITLALPVYAAKWGIYVSPSPGVVYYHNYPNSCNRLVWVGPQMFDNGTWIPGHYITVNTCYPNPYYGYTEPNYFYYRHGHTENHAWHDKGKYYHHQHHQGRYSHEHR